LLVSAVHWRHIDIKRFVEVANLRIANLSRGGRGTRRRQRCRGFPATASWTLLSEFCKPRPKLQDDLRA
jgi:hypothetical protein